MSHKPREHDIERKVNGLGRRCRRCEPPQCRYCTDMMEACPKCYPGESEAPERTCSCCGGVLLAADGQYCYGCQVYLSRMEETLPSDPYVDEDWYP
jgi:hypothetical protein